MNRLLQHERRARSRHRCTRFLTVLNFAALQLSVVDSASPAPVTVFLSPRLPFLVCRIGV